MNSQVSFRQRFTRFLPVALASVLGLSAVPALADASLGVGRFQDFESLEWETAWGVQEVDGWEGNQIIVYKPGVHGAWDSRVGFIRNEIGDYVRTPLLEDGIGVLYFRLRNFNSSEPITFSVEVSVDGIDWLEIGSGVNTSWGLGSGPAWTWHQFEINRYDDVYVRVRRTNKNNDLTTQSLAFDDITASPPPADVTISERLYQPGYPSQKQETRVRAWVQDKDPLVAPTSNRVVQVFYRWQQGDLQSTNMVEIGEDLYEGVIPVHPAGEIEYFFRCDFDGYAYSHAPTETDEAKTPRFLPEADAFERPSEPGVEDWLRFQIRRFDSRHALLHVDAEPVGAASPMLLVDDYTWQAVVEVSAFTNIVMRFEGLERYTNNAPEYLEAPDYWADPDQEYIFPPLASFAALDPDARIELDFVYDGFLMFRFNTETLEYTVKRAAFQDFDDWQASIDRFEYSLGLFAVQSFPADFDTWTPDTVGIGQRSIEDFEAESVSDEQFQWLIQTANFWAGSNARRIRERVDAPDDRNRAMMLNFKPESRGRVFNTGDSMVDGLNTLGFRYRSALQDDHFTWYKGGFGWGNVTVEAEMRAGSMSPDTASISLFARVADPLNYYELRLLQIPDTRASDNRLQSQLWRCKDGVLELLDETTTTAISGQLTAPAYHTLSLSVETTALDIRLTGVVNGTPRHDNIADSLASGLTGNGTIGFHSRDAVPVINTVAVGPIGGSPTWTTTFIGASMDDWFTAGLRSDTGETRWHIDDDLDVLTRELPTQTFYVQTVPRTGTEYWPDMGNWQTRQTLSVNSFSYQTQTITLKDWQETFVSLWQDEGDTPIVVDELEIDPWRGRTRTENDWTVSEAWIQSLGPDLNELQLDRTRANPALDQAVTSTLLTNGIGTIEFDYTVSGGTAEVAIERTAVNDPNAWITLDEPALTSGSSGTYYLAVRTNMVGRIRVRHRPESGASALLRIRDLVVTDYPLAGDTTWIAYNVMITGPAHPDPSVVDSLFVPTDLDGQTAFLNNSPTNDTADAFRGDDDLPYIQSPAIGTGLGEIGFWYRVWDPADPTPATIMLRKAEHQEVPAENWQTITNIVIEPLNGEHVSSYQYFSMTTFDIENKVFRLYVETNGMQRVGIDNLLITEPVRAGFDIVEVMLDPPQPEVGETVGVQARLENFLMNPQDIALRVEYYVGTNVWGRANWPSTNSVPMVQDPLDERLYLTDTSRIPSQSIDDVVQFRVVATYTDPGSPFAEPIAHDQFTNPEWYYPVDLNDSFDGWSPYYFVYSCPPGSVWINEFNHDYPFAMEDVEYVELMGPAGSNIANWQIKLYGTDMQVYTNTAVNPGFVIPNVTNGWGFFVWGDSTIETLLPGSTVHQAFNPEQSQNIRIIGGIHLERSMGAWEHRVSYGGTAAQAMPEFEYITARKQSFADHPYNLMHDPNDPDPEPGSSYDDFVWRATGSYTPGGLNVGQSVVSIENGNGPPPLASITIEQLNMVGATIEVIATGTNQWTPTLWYRTNLQAGVWQQVTEDVQTAYQDGYFTITAPRDTEAPVIFYRVNADPE